MVTSDLFRKGVKRTMHCTIYISHTLTHTKKKKKKGWGGHVNEGANIHSCQANKGTKKRKHKRESMF